MEPSLHLQCFHMCWMYICCSPQIFLEKPWNVHQDTGMLLRMSRKCRDVTKMSRIANNAAYTVHQCYVCSRYLRGSSQDGLLESKKTDREECRVGLIDREQTVISWNYWPTSLLLILLSSSPRTVLRQWLDKGTTALSRPVEGAKPKVKSGRNYKG